MGRLHVETIQIDPVLLRRTADGAVLTPEILADYAAKLRAQGRRTDIVHSCERVLRQFYDFLSADKLVGKNTLSDWRDQLLAEHYAVRSVNSKVSTVNALLESMGCREFQVTKQLPAEDFDTPELTRQEYVRMLQTAKILEDERAYVLTKLFATTGIAVLDLPAVTVEAVQTGHAVLKPANLQADLLRYARENGHPSGMIFTKKDGSAIARTQVSLFIQKLALEEKVPAEKGNIRALRQLYKTTISGIEANFDLLVRQAYERQLETEQLSVGWE